MHPSTRDVPAWDHLTADVHRQRVEQALERAQQAQHELAGHPSAPTFDNTILGIEQLQAIVAQAWEPFAMQVTFDAPPDIQAVEEALTEPMARWRSSLFQDPALWQRVQAVVANPPADLAEDARWLIEQTRQRFVRAGAHLDAATRAQVQTWSAELAQQQVLFGKQVLAATQVPFWVTDPARLTGLSEDTLQDASARAAEQGRPGAWAFHLGLGNVRSVLESSTDPTFRRELWEAAEGRCKQGDHDTRPTIRQILILRARIARALGYDHWAQFALADQMAGTPANAEALLLNVWRGALPQFQRERAAIETQRRQQGDTTPMHPADWHLGAEQVRQSAYAFDSQQMQRYLTRDRVRQGLFEVTGELFGVRYEAAPELPVFAERVDAYRVVRDTDRGTEDVGVLYVDDFQRPTKPGGAWMEVARSQAAFDNRVYPVVGNALNLTDSSESPVMTMDEVLTAFHELGHGLHGLLSQVRFASQSGVAVPTDFVELPSQLLENWAQAPEVLKRLSHHVDTGAPIPDAMISRWQSAARFNGGFEQGEYLLSALMDLRLHQVPLEALETLDLDAFTQQVKADLGAPDLLPPRYDLTHFTHIFQTDYAARYYAYLWSEVLDADVFSAFQQQGLFNPDLAQKLKTEIYAKGHSRPVAESFRALMGRDPDPAALMRRKGFAEIEPEAAPAHRPGRRM